MKKKLWLFALTVLIAACSVKDESLVGLESSVDSEVLIKQTNEFSIYKIGRSHSLVSKLFMSERNVNSEILNLGQIDDENIYVLKRSDSYVLQIGILREQSPGKFEEATIVAVSTEDIERHFIHYTIAKADLVVNHDGTQEYENFDLEVLSSSDLAVPYKGGNNEVEIAKTSMSSNRHSGVLFMTTSSMLYEDTCVEEYYAEMRDDCLDSMACDIACTLLLQACRLEWAAIASTRCFWDWYYGVEYFAPEV